MPLDTPGLITFCLPHGLADSSLCSPTGCGLWATWALQKLGLFHAWLQAWFSGTEGRGRVEGHTPGRLQTHACHIFIALLPHCKLSQKCCEGTLLLSARRPHVMGLCQQSKAKPR